MVYKVAVALPAVTALAIAFGCFTGPLSRTAHASGVYEDTAAEAAFLLAPHQNSLSSRIVRTNGDSKDASIFVLSGAYPLRSYLLVDFEQTYVTVSAPGNIKRGFGDLRLRARARLFHREGRALRLTSAFRTGSGSVRLFPYASQSMDLELGLSYTDTLEAIHFWGVFGGAMVKREPEQLVEAKKHENFGRLCAGITLPMTSGMGVNVGMTALLFRSGGGREIYMASLEYAFSESTRLVLAVHAEAGKREERISDLALSAGIRIFYPRAPEPSESF